MKYFVCNCKWGYVIGQKKVFGPIFTDDNDSGSAHMMSREDFESGYGDCYYDYQKRFNQYPLIPKD